MKKKVKVMISVVCTLWIVAFAQILLTRFYVERNAVTQAFARNQLAIQEQSKEVENISKEGGWIKGTVAGKLSTEEKRKLAAGIFAYEGGGSRAEHESEEFYVAYGYSNGIDLRLCREIQGKRINMNVAITYDETQDKSVVYFGVPILFNEF